MQLTEQQSRWPAWSPDGKSILYVTGSLLMKYRIGHAGAEVLTEMTAGDLGGFSHGIGVASGGSPLRTLDHNSPQVYEIEFAKR